MISMCFAAVLLILGRHELRVVIGELLQVPREANSGGFRWVPVGSGNWAGEAFSPENKQNLLEFRWKHTIRTGSRKLFFT